MFPVGLHLGENPDPIRRQVPEVRLWIQMLPVSSRGRRRSHTIAVSPGDQQALTVLVSPLSSLLVIGRSEEVSRSRIHN